ncbi:MAG: ion transporter [Oscillospiraceae bacterium]|nr:ion transporter [Oscillospiraceae bacterium]
MRKRIFEIIEIAEKNDRLSAAYDTFMMIVIAASVIPLAFKTSNIIFNVIDQITAYIFIIDYILRLITADFKIKKGTVSFALYPFTPMALIDILAILPSFTAISSGFRLVKLLRLFRTFRVFRSFKIFRYSKSIEIIVDVIKSQKAPLLAVCSLAAGYVLISALIVFNVEPDTFNTYFDAVYWATVSLTTVGYGDIYPVTTVGRVVTMFSSFVGIAIVALPSGIITAGYLDRIHDTK